MQFSFSRIFILIILSAGIYFFNIYSVRAEISACGHINEEDYEETYKAAEKIRYHYDVRKELIDICTRLEEFKNWEKNIKITSKYRSWRDEILARTRKNLKGMKSLLMLLGTWHEHIPESKQELALKRARISEKKIQIQKSFIKLENNLKSLEEFKTQYNSRQP